MSGPIKIADEIPSIPTTTSTTLARVPTRKAERVNVERAGQILGLATRTVQRMSQRGELPGAALMGRRWTYNEDKLHGYVRNKEREIWHGLKHRLDVSGRVTPSMAASKLKAKPASGRFAQAIQKLRHNGAQRGKNVR
jgi:hypothetical protein